MKRTVNDYLLTQAASECCEVAHRITKAQHFGIDEVQPGQELNNAERIMDEYVQLTATMELLYQQGLLPLTSEAEWARRSVIKKERIYMSMHYAQSLGLLEDV